MPTDSPGFSIRRVIKMFGHIGGDEAEVALDDVRVEPWQLVGELNQGFKAALYGVSWVESITLRVPLARGVGRLN